MKKLGKISKVILIVVALQFCMNFMCAQKAFAASTITDIMQSGKDWISNGENAATKQDANLVNPNYYAGELIGVGQVLVVIGLATVLIVGTIMGIQWITATPDKQAKLKQQLIGLVVATVVIFGAVGIWNLVRSIMSNISGEL